MESSQAPAERAPRDLKLDCAGVVLAAAAVFIAASLVGADPADAAFGAQHPANATARNWCGPIGAHVAARLFEVLGFAAVLPPVLVAASASYVFGRRSMGAFVWQFVGFVLLACGSSVLLARVGVVGWGPAAFPGGLLGLVASARLVEAISNVGTWLVAGSLTCIGAVLLHDNFAPGIGRLARRLISLASRSLRRAPEPPPKPGYRLAPEPVEKKSSSPSPLPSTAVELFDVVEEETIPLEKPKPRDKGKLRINRLTLDQLPEKPALVATQKQSAGPFMLPTLDMLDEVEIPEENNQEEEIRQQAEIIEQFFAEYKMGVKVVQIDMGPVVTQYEIELDPGIRVRNIVALADDVAREVRAQSVRIVAPIPGKNTVGIEVPNEKRAKVCLREVAAKSIASASAMRLPFYLGKDVKGQPLVCDLAKMPHLLIAGRTGTGKSVCLNSLILSVLMCRTPDQVKMLMIDPKMVELSLFRDIPHLLSPVVTDPKKAEALLGWAVDKMEERYALLASVSVRHIDAYNKLTYQEKVARCGEENDALRPHMPYILIFADEMADLMMTSAKEVETHIIRLAQKSRAVGIHLILATQKPTVDVITGLIKSNLPARIGFQVASRTDSRVVLDEMGADKLLGNGDMLFLDPATSKIIRAQGTYVSETEVERVTTYLAKQAKPEFAPELLNLKAKSDEDDDDGPKGDPSQRDDMYFQAVDLVVREQRGSVSLLQRGLGIGYGRAARLIDYMAEDGIVGPYSGSQAREVLYSPDQWTQIRRDRWGLAN